MMGSVPRHKSVQLRGHLGQERIAGLQKEEVVARKDALPERTPRLLAPGRELLVACAAVPRPTIRCDRAIERHLILANAQSHPANRRSERSASARAEDQVGDGRRFRILICGARRAQTNMWTGLASRSRRS